MESIENHALVDDLKHANEQIEHLKNINKKLEKDKCEILVVFLLFNNFCLVILLSVRNNWRVDRSTAATLVCDGTVVHTRPCLLAGQLTTTTESLCGGWW